MELFVGLLLVIVIYFLALVIVTLPIWGLWNALVPAYFTGLPEKLNDVTEQGEVARYLPMTVLPLSCPFRASAATPAATESPFSSDEGAI